MSRAALALLLVVACWSTPARAEDQTARARALYQQGVSAYASRDYERAVEAFRESHALEPRAETLFAWAQAERLSGDCPSAMLLYRQFLDGERTEVQAEAARQALVRCERSLASRPLEEPAPAVVPPVEPKAITAAAPPPPPAPAPRRAPPPRRRHFWQDPLGDALVGGGLVAATVGVVLLATGASPDDATTYDDFADRRDRAITRKRAGAVALGLGAALVAGGVTRWVLWAGEDEAGVMVAGRF